MTTVLCVCSVVVAVVVLYSSSSSSSIVVVVYCISIYKNCNIQYNTVHNNTMYIIYEHYILPLTLHQRLSHWYTAFCQPGP